MSIVQWSDDALHGNSGGFLSNAFSSTPADDVWVYLAITQNGGGSSTTRWWNAAGSLQESQNCDETTGTPNSVTVGDRAGYLDNQRNGRYAYWKLWDRALSQANLEADMFSPTVVGTSDFNSGFADSTTDIGPNGRNWTENGTSWDADTPPVNLGSPVPIIHHYRMMQRKA
jgi:hypothetical protein